MDGLHPYECLHPTAIPFPHNNSIAQHSTLYAWIELAADKYAQKHWTDSKSTKHHQTANHLCHFILVPFASDQPDKGNISSVQSGCICLIKRNKCCIVVRPPTVFAAQDLFSEFMRTFGSERKHSVLAKLGWLGYWSGMPVKQFS